MTTEEEQKQKCFDVSVQIRNFEIELFWKRSLFFWGFIASAFIGYAALRAQHSDLAIIVACFGMVCSFAWSLVNRGSKYWQESWENKVKCYDAVFSNEFFCKVEDVQKKGCWLQARRYSVSKISIALSDYMFVLWLAVIATELAHLIYAPQQLSQCLKDVGIAVFVVFSFVYLVLLWCFGKSEH